MGHGKGMTMMETPWREMNGFHSLLHLSHQPVMKSGDLAPVKRTAGLLADAAAAWAKSTAPAECKAPADIGIRKAVGARGGDIKQQFLAESVAIAVVGTGIGLVLGLVLAAAVTAGFRFFVEVPVYPVLSVGTVLMAIVSSPAVGLIFGTFPARRAVSLPVIAAIAHE